MFEKFVHKTPFLRLVLPFILGILFQIFYKKPTIPIGYIFIPIIIFTAILEIFKFTSEYRLNRFWGLIVTLLLFLYGVQLVQYKQAAKPNFIRWKNSYIATIIQQPEVKKSSIKAILRIDFAKDSISWTKSHSKIIAYFKKDSNTYKLSYGDQIIFHSNLTEVKNSGNPYIFDYKKYLEYKEIYFNAFINSTNYKFISHNNASRIKSIALKTRQKLLSIYKKNNLLNKEYGIIPAITLGYTEELSPDLKNNFAISGLMHILAVSGLHVGIIFIILFKILFFLKKLNGEKIQSIVVILILVFYAFVTGFSNSVIRATIMFSFISFGKMFTRELNIYNTILASAFIMLLFNPYAIMEVSFQLSYVAVLSIVFFQPKIYSLLTFKRLASDYIWKLISVTIAAQIGTFPITIFYFGMFPVYFLLSNIIAIPLATILIYLAVSLFIFSFSKVVSFYISTTLQFFTTLLNKIVNFISYMPYSKIENVNLDHIKVMLLYLFLFSLSFFIISKKQYFLKISLFALIIFSGYYCYTFYDQSKQTLFIIHNIKGISAINIINKKNCNIISDTNICQTDNIFKQIINPVLTEYGIDRYNTILTKNLNQAIQYFKVKDLKIVRLQYDSLLNFKPQIKLKVNYIVLSKNVNFKISDLSSFFEFDKIIFDSSNSYKSIHKWKKECLSTGIKFYNVIDDGAFIMYL